MKQSIALIAILICPYVYGQELSNIGKSPLLKVNGGLSANQTFNWSDIPGSYRQPYAYTFMANLNFLIYDWSIALSGMYSNRQWSYQQPFNRFSLNPSYKWIKIYMGYNSMNFSNYTLNGHRFYGGGVELTPQGKWKFSVMAGRMQERVLPDTSTRVIPAYNRFGTGFKTEYTFKGGNIGLSTFYARENKKSLAGFDSLTITPAENLAMAINSTFNLLKNLNIAVEYSTSLFTENTQLPKADDRYVLMPFYPRRESSHTFNAYKSNVVYNSPYGSIGAGYERVEPGYRTLGVYTSVNDFENYTFSYTGQIIPEKLNLAASIGIQNDDLENNKAQSNTRRVGSVNIGFIPVKTVNTNLTYGNYRNFTHIRTGFEEINNTTPYPYADTLDYTQVSENFGASVSITPEAKENVKRGIILSANYQKASEQQSDNLNHASNRFFNGMAGYNQSFVKQALSFNTGFNFNRNMADTITTVTFGPSLSVRKTFFDKKFNTNFSFAYNQSRLNAVLQSYVFIVRSGAGFTLKERHSFDFSAAFASRNNILKHTKTGDITMMLTYRYNFKSLQLDLKKKKEPAAAKNVNEIKN